MAYSIAYRITNDATLAEDVVQDAFLGAWRNAARYVEGRGSVKTWLLSIVHHRAIDAIRRRRPTTDLPEREDAPPAGAAPARRLGRGVVEPRCRCGARRARVALRRPARGDRARLLRRADPAGDRRADRDAARDREEPDAARPARDAGDAVAMTDARRPGGQPGGLTCDEVRDLAASYVLGALTDQEMDAVREHLADCPETHAEFAELGSVVPALDAAVPLMEPPTGLRERVMAAAAADLDARRQADIPPVAASEQPAQTRSRCRPGRGRRTDPDRSEPGAALDVGRGHRGGLGVRAPRGVESRPSGAARRGEGIPGAGGVGARRSESAGRADGGPVGSLRPGSQWHRRRDVRREDAHRDAGPRSHRRRRGLRDVDDPAEHGTRPRRRDSPSVRTGPASSKRAACLPSRAWCSPSRASRVRG